ncbi:MAG: hypothetical protein RR602_03270 [Longicatena sp.]
MLYLSGVHALNIDCLLNTTGDWHCSAIRWDVIDKRLKDSSYSVFKDYGIEKDKQLFFLDRKPKYNVANHIRACLDLIEEGNFAQAQGMRKDFICTNEYDKEIFRKVLLLKNSNQWDKVDNFMGKEYSMKWFYFKKEEGIQND